MRFGRILLIMAAALAITGSVRTSHAVLNAVDPGSPPGTYSAAFGFFPAWYQDTHGRGLELCLSAAEGPNGPMCVLLPNPGIFDPTQAIVFPTNFPDESFWFAADGAVAGSGVDIRYVAAVEAAFGAGVPDPGDQVSFARIRFVGDVSVLGTYIITHPYGVETFEVTELTNGPEIRLTRDIGVAPGIFTGALKGDIGPFLHAADAPGGTPTPITIVNETFIGDPNVTQAVTGSPFGTNFLRVQGPGVDVQDDQFFLAGKIYPVALQTPLIVDRTTYGRTAGGTQVDVFATSAPTADVSFAPPTPSIPMGGDPAGRFFGQDPNPAAIPVPVTVTAGNPPLNNSPVSKESNVTDVVTIVRAEYNNGTLTIEASSSDEDPLPVLTAGTLGDLNHPLAGPIQTLTVSGLTIPPATVTVTSGAGGSDTEEIDVLP